MVVSHRFFESITKLNDVRASIVRSFSPRLARLVFGLQNKDHHKPSKDQCASDGGVFFFFFGAVRSLVSPNRQRPAFPLSPLGLWKRRVSSGGYLPLLYMLGIENLNWREKSFHGIEEAIHRTLIRMRIVNFRDLLMLVVFGMRGRGVALSRFREGCSTVTNPQDAGSMIAVWVHPVSALGLYFSSFFSTVICTSSSQPGACGRLGPIGGSVFASRD
jgi:hypothetical protein